MDDWITGYLEIQSLNSGPEQTELFNQCTRTVNECDDPERTMQRITGHPVRGDLLIMALSKIAFRRF